MPGGNQKGFAKICQLPVKPVFIRQKIFKSTYIMFFNQEMKISRKVLGIVRMVELPIDYLVTLRLERFSKIPHAQKESDHFLDMVTDIACFLLHFHHDVESVRMYFAKPRVMNVELIAKNQAQGFGHKRCTD